VLPYLRRAVDAGTLRHAEATVVERVCERLPQLAGPVEPPARAARDLWRRERAVGCRRTRPADRSGAHGGHRETDLAMLHLFGCPHLPEVLDGYRKPRARPGWADRHRAAQLFPLLVHVVLSAAVMPRQALSVARAALA